MSAFDIEKTRQDLIQLTQEQGIAVALKNLANLYQTHTGSPESKHIAALNGAIIETGLATQENGYLAKCARVLEWYELFVGSMPEDVQQSAVSIIDAAIDENTDQALHDSYKTLHMMHGTVGNNVVYTHATRVLESAQKHVSPLGATVMGLAYDIIASTAQDMQHRDMALRQYVDNVVLLNDPKSNQSAMEKLVSIVELHRIHRRPKKQLHYIAPLALDIMEAASECPLVRDNIEAMAMGIEMMQDNEMDEHPAYAQRISQFEMLLPLQTRENIERRRTEQNKEKLLRKLPGFMSPN